MHRLLKEPLVHFLLLGAALFGIGALTGGDNAAQPNDSRIIVDQARVEELAERFTRERGRRPSADELDGLIDEHVLEEAYVRRANELELGEEDTFIRHRLRDKLEILTEDPSALEIPGDAELEKFMRENKSRFLRGGSYTFRQIFIDRGKHGDGLELHLANLLEQLRAGEEMAGDNGLPPEAYQESSTRVVVSLFGVPFAEGLDRLEPGRWDGPIESRFGLHLVKLESRVPGELPGLDAIRRRVEREWVLARQAQARGRYDQKLLEDFEVIVERPDEPQQGP